MHTSQMLQRKCCMMKFPHWRLFVAAAVISFCYVTLLGFNDTVFNIPAQDIRAFLQSSFSSRYGHNLSVEQEELLWSATVGAYGIGLVVGGPIVGVVADRFGRKNSLLLGGTVLLIVGHLLMALSKLANSFEMIIVGRFVVGFECCAGLGLAMLWLMESSPIAHAGFIGTFCAAFEDIGMLLAQILGLPQVLGSAKSWPVLLGLGAVPGVLGLAIGMWFPESPKYLHVVRSADTSAIDSLQFYHGALVDYTRILREYETEAAVADNVANRISLRTLWRVQRYRYPLLITVVANLLPSISGWFVVTIYSTMILESYGLTKDQADGFTAVMMLANLASAVLAPIFIQLVNRRTLFLVTCITAIISNAIVCIAALIYELSFQSVHLGLAIAIMFLVLAFCYNLGVGSIALILPVEISPLELRPWSVAIGVTVVHLGMFISQTFFDMIFRRTRGYIFLLFPIASIPVVVYILYLLPESRNRHLHEILETWKRGSVDESMPLLSGS